MNGKDAIDKDWPRGGYDDPERWTKKLEHHTGNVGLVTGCRPDRTGLGLIVCDYDVYKPAGEISYEIARDVGWLIDTPTVQTPSGGFHMLVRYDPAAWVVKSKDMKGKPIPGSDAKFPGGFEIKAEGGYVAYYGTYLEGQGLDDMPIADAPESLLEVIGQRIDPDSGDVIGGTVGPWARYDPELVHGDTAYAVKLLTEHFGAHDAVVVRSGPEPHVEVKRPGKTTGSRSATVGWLKPGLVKVFTDGWPPFTQGQVVDVAELERLADIERPPQVTVPRVELPDGYRMWSSDDGAVPAPTLGEPAYHGPVGDHLRLLEGQTEAHPAAVAIQVLGITAAMVGRRAQYRAGSIWQPCNLFVAVVGDTSTGGKGVAHAEAARLMDAVDPQFSTRHSIMGLGSGEALIHEVRDPDPQDENSRGGLKNRIVHTEELSSKLKVAGRDGNVLSDHLRVAFDGGPLRHSTKTYGVVMATGHHISIIGAITPTELRYLLSDLSRSNGFGNRFLFVWSQIGGLLPFGGDVDEHELQRVAATIRARLEELERRTQRNGGSIDYVVAPGARDAWAQLYRRVRAGIGEDPCRSLTARAVAHAARIATIYALLDGARDIDRVHVDAASAWIDYGAQTVGHVFGGQLSGAPGKLLAAVRDAAPDGLTLTEQSATFGRNLSADDIRSARQHLEAERLIVTVRSAPDGPGRPPERSIAIWPDQTHLR